MSDVPQFRINASKHHPVPVSDLADQATLYLDRSHSPEDVYAVADQLGIPVRNDDKVTYNQANAIFDELVNRHENSFRTGDRVAVYHGDQFSGNGLITKIRTISGRLVATVETYDGFTFIGPVRTLVKIDK